MKKMPKKKNDDLRPEYDASMLKGGIRGKYFQKYWAGRNIILLAPDVAKAFPDDLAVNNALRLLLRVARTSLKR